MAHKHQRGCEWLPILFLGCANFWTQLTKPPPQKTWSLAGKTIFMLWCFFMCCGSGACFMFCQKWFMLYIFVISFLCLKKKKNQTGNQASHVLGDDFVSQDVYNRFMLHPWRCFLISRTQELTCSVKVGACTSSVPKSSSRPVWLLCPCFCVWSPPRDKPRGSHPPLDRFNFVFQGTLLVIVFINRWNKALSISHLTWRLLAFRTTPWKNLPTKEKEIDTVAILHPIQTSVQTLLEKNHTSILKFSLTENHSLRDPTASLAWN